MTIARAWAGSRKRRAANRSSAIGEARYGSLAMAIAYAVSQHFYSCNGTQSSTVARYGYLYVLYDEEAFCGRRVAA